ncbi:peptidase inhibitor family I36 protein [Streptomyces sp. NPDC050439]|uniref:peptidase inhibitor family I36 protein n=1 Tax=unclassified Streptomyces TaxID=2593676 RepID=UPI003419DDB3
MRTMKMVLVGVGSAALLATGGTMTAGAAPAQGVDAQAAWSCTKGAVCFYTGSNGDGTRYERHADSNSNFKSINSARNNGHTDEPYDHVKVKWNYPGSSDSKWGCLSPGEKWEDKKTFEVDAVRWVKSC